MAAELYAPADEFARTIIEPRRRILRGRASAEAIRAGPVSGSGLGPRLRRSRHASRWSISALDFWLTTGRFNEQFENSLASLGRRAIRR